MRTILELSHTDAREFFLKQESYSSVDLPKYFDFQPLLNALSRNGNIGNIALKNAKKLDDVNYKFLTNKDGKFAWRPIQLINPAIYVNLVNKITKEENWKHIASQFKKFQANEKIKCSSIPIIAIGGEKPNKAKTITNWWQQVEQQSLELALNYDCFMNTDITDCYGSIYTHTIPWALHGKEKVKKDILAGIKRKEIGDNIDTTIQSMQHSQTNGIPQGSALMDFIAEMVLGYADRILSCKIYYYNRREEKYKIEDYQILRYRDDYRIFATNQETVVKIAKLLTETLIDLNLKLNSQKTFISDNIVRDVIKPDKLYWNEATQERKSLQKQLFLIHSLAEKHPNSGSLATALTRFLEEKIYPLRLFQESENSKILVSILADIAYRNPRTYPVITAILSKILSLETNPETVAEILDSIEKKFDKIPNVGHLQVWLQRLTIKTERKKDYTEKLCQKVIDRDVDIWNIDWIQQQPIREEFANNSIVNEDQIEAIPQVVEPDEIKIFGY
ncbi:MAG: RNA-directed DNA polymerase [Bacteroidales bacterium]|nr:RNA-directed DNA polymerase [Bacteroidales bacterium]